MEELLIDAYKVLYDTDDNHLEKQLNLVESGILPEAKKILDDYEETHKSLPKVSLQYMGPMSNSAPMTNPSRILIAISGFLQEGKDGDKAWSKLIEHANSKNIGTFIFGWKASTKK